MSDHPWDKFLKARADVIDWMKEQHSHSDERIAILLSMDESQVRLIRNRTR